MGKKLTMFLIDGTDNGPRTIDIGNWSGKAIHSPRASLIETIKRDEYDNPGIYILKSDPKGDVYSERIYIGEAENIRQRLKQHLRDQEKDFNECIVFVSNDDLLTKSHIKYIESRLIALAFDSKNAEVDNTNRPPKNTLSEADISDMEYFIEQIKLILPVTGYNFLISNRAPESSDNQAESSGKHTEVIFHIRGKKVSAQMKETKDGFVVLKGSQSNLEESASLASGWRKLRSKLIKNATLETDGLYYIFSEDTVFSSISAAASIVLGRQAAGPFEWRDKKNRTYKDYISEAIGND